MEVIAIVNMWEMDPLSGVHGAQLMVDNLEAELLEINSNSQKLQQTVNELNELAQVLQKVHLIYAPCFTQVYKLGKFVEIQ